MSSNPSQPHPYSRLPNYRSLQMQRHHPYPTVRRDSSVQHINATQETSAQQHSPPFNADYDFMDVVNFHIVVSELEGDTCVEPRDFVELVKIFALRMRTRSQLQQEMAGPSR